MRILKTLKKVVLLIINSHNYVCKGVSFKLFIYYNINFCFSSVLKETKRNKLKCTYITYVVQNFTNKLLWQDSCLGFNG